LEKTSFFFQKANPVASSSSVEPSQRAQSGGPRKNMRVFLGLRYVLIPLERVPISQGPNDQRISGTRRFKSIKKKEEMPFFEKRGSVYLPDKVRIDRLKALS